MGARNDIFHPLGHPSFRCQMRDKRGGGILEVEEPLGVDCDNVVEVSGEGRLGGVRWVNNHWVRGAFKGGPWAGMDINTLLTELPPCHTERWFSSLA
eukprot:scaffold208882_cov35-Attheya_sp.AAC.1